jgi:hypothetical protein
MKNPLYVIKGKDVLEARNFFDLVLKKFNLEPVVQILQNILKMLLDNIKSYPTFISMKNTIDEVMAKLMVLAEKYGVA